MEAALEPAEALQPEVADEPLGREVAAGGVVLYAAAAFFFDGIFKVDPALRPEIRDSVPYLALAVPIATTTGVLSGALQARDRFLETNMISVLSTSLFQIFPIVVALIWGPNLSQLLLASVAARGVAIYTHEHDHAHSHAASRVRIRQVKKMMTAELRVQRDTHQTALA